MNPNEPLPLLIPAPCVYTTMQGNCRLTMPFALEGTQPPASAPAVKLLLNSSPLVTNEGTGTLLLFAEDSTLQPEAYRLSVESISIRIDASSKQGFLYAVQTLRQLTRLGFASPDRIESEKDVIPCIKIEDSPRFGWRGLLLDSARHFQPVPDILRILDQMAVYKLNRFHWHLIDDQGWRIEIDRYPLLGDIGGYRKSPDGTIDGGVYTKSEVRTIVEYADSLGIDVIPEIELPGHSSAAIAAYPWLSCHEGPKNVPHRWGVYTDIACAGNDRVIDFYKHVMEEIVDLFPAPFVHIGGDEAPKDFWQKCPLCQQRIRALGLRDENALQTWMTMELQKFLASHGRTVIGWDELEEGGMPPGAILQHWRFPERLRGALTAGHNAIISKNTHCYFDYHYDKPPERYSKDTQKDDWMPALPTEKVYAFDPIDDKWMTPFSSQILGIEATLWTEFIPPARIDEKLFPRLLAFAERAWSPKERRDFSEFSDRLAAHIGWLKTQGIHPYQGPQAPLEWKQIYPPGLEPKTPVA